MPIELKDVKEAIEEQGKANHERLKTFETRVVELEKKGLTTAETKEKLDKIVKDLSDLEAVKSVPERLKLIEAQIKRQQTAVKEDGDSANTVVGTKEARKAMRAFIRRGKYADSESKEFKFQLSETLQAQIKEMAKGDPDEEVKTGMSVLSDPDGGYTVTADLNGRVIEQMFETSDMRAICSVQQIGTDALEGFYDDNTGTSGGWVGETDARAESATPQLGKWAIPVHEQYAYPFTTQKLLDDSNLDPESWLAKKIADILGRTENTAFVTGDGDKKPRGIMTYTAGTTLRTTIEQIVTGSATGVTWQGLVNIQMALKARYRKNARWGASRLGIAEFMKLADDQHRPLWLPSLREGEPSLMMGHPIAELNDLASITTNSLSYLFADFMEGYQIVDRMGIRILRNPFATMGRVGFYTTKRVGGQVLNTEAIKIGKCST